VARSLTKAESLLDLVGNTPLVELKRLSPKPTVQIYAKLEGQNPTGSIKDRVAKAMIDAAEASGELTPGRELLEPTSGNTGISLALIAKLKGYKLTCVMPENATEERRRLLRLYGATIIDSPGDQGSNGAVRLALELAEKEPKFFMPFQYANPMNPRAHYEGTGAEIAEALDRVDVLVAGLGTGGTLMGTGERLRESFPDIVIAAAEPLPGDAVMGLRSLDDGYVPPILDVSKLDRKVLVSNAESVAAVHALLDLEGIFAGVSAGAAVHVARKLADELEEGVVVTILADAGWKYLSADFWETDDVAQRYERGRNGAASPYRFELEVDPELWFLEDDGYELAVFHSHLSSQPRPSRTDVENIGLWEGKPYLIYCVRDDDLAAWTIQDGEIAALPLS
jgi:cysteine synthase/proteasome lid subunit RPN8/RPN11